MVDSMCSARSRDVGDPTRSTGRPSGELLVADNDGLSIAYRAWGPRTQVGGRAALVFIHGWAQSHRAWGGPLLAGLATGRRVIAMDLRGHGASGIPELGEYPSAHFTSRHFAGDVQAVLEAEGLQDPSRSGGYVLIGWSYGGLVACDHLRAVQDGGGVGGDSNTGTAGLRGLVLVGAITGIGRDSLGGQVGSAMRRALPDALSEQTPVAVRALASFGSAMVPADRADLGATSQLLFGTSLATPPAVRRALFTRSADNDGTLAALSAPALVIHGTADTVVDIASARHNASVLGDVRTHWWEGVGHAPFLADPQRFAAEIEEFLVELDSAVVS
ncbi:alpha/beta hydrolase [Gordonia jinhuaensis]|uniref:Alpha/beta hydrolase n=2 Tax=Gordonia jinhuaensis TaxID=1517702 RepID=A0A916T616_9ACTN|nr:alpha/beta hydrolase [Gordonia jinhuaensis]